MYNFIWNQTLWCQVLILKFVFPIRFSCLTDTELDQRVEAIKMDMPDVGQTWFKVFFVLRELLFHKDVFVKA